MVDFFNSMCGGCVAALVYVDTGNWFLTLIICLAYFGVIAIREEVRHLFMINGYED